MINGDQLKEDVIGRWVGVFQSLGVDIGDGRHKSCPMCGGVDRFRFDDKEGKGTYYCNGCGAGDGWKIVQKVLGVDFPGALKEVASIIGSVEKSPKKKESTMTAEKMRKIFNESKLVNTGDPVYRYLTGRGLTNIPKMLRYSPKCWELETSQNQKAMLAVFMGPDNKAQTMHRTYLDADGNKLNIKDVRKILPFIGKKDDDDRPTGGACRLFPLDEKMELGIAEGIETAIAATELFGIPTWAATTAIFLEKFYPPKNIKKIVIYGDNDNNYTGQKAAYALANTMSVVRKIEVEVRIPETTGHDWLDYLQGKNHV